ncbi:hypothetical protein H2O64_15925 [Kordia sp. YSTF-M3]|uniref:Uncharacterized protein n=1 Tax=Kordia aestuariivivens TaxID=2759037 RepID=A0ABR7QC63_9FLAO|nr:hypothetical protein [Kordia aestuariivivens]MBC8756165.1 hypothetical protein [Kordia aestuariivivens]
MKNQIEYMFLKALQYKSSKKLLTQKLDKVATKEVNTNPVKTVGIIINADETDNIQEILDGLKLPAEINILCYHKEFKKTRTLAYPVFYEKDFGWKGKPKTEDLKHFLEKPFDLLISYYSENIVPLQLVSGLHKANFKVGISGSDQQIHDLIIQTEKSEIATFTKELHTYLHILNKL